jgi:membrane protein YqaA with SNARE-associated domain
MAFLIMVPNTSMVFDAMRIVEGYNITLMLPLAIFGEVAGGSCNYLFGRLLNYVKHSIMNSDDSKKFLALKNIANEKLFILVGFAFIPLVGVLITSTAGFLKVSYSRFLIVFLFGRVLFYLLKLS